MKIYIVAQASDEYSDTLQLPDVLREGDLSPYWTAQGFKSMVFESLGEAKAYLESFNGKPAYSDGSGNMRDELSIYETNKP